MADLRDIAQQLTSRLPAPHIVPQTSERRVDRTESSLIIVRRDRAEIFCTLEQHFHRERDVSVMWDRRTAERRAGGGAASRNRRLADRRAVTPSTWSALGILVTRTGRRRPV